VAKRVAKQTFIQRSRSVTAEAKARFHQIDGAGTSRVKRPFLGLTPDEERDVDRRIEALIDGELGKRG
jgi:hypothetical protein